MAKKNKETPKLHPFEYIGAHKLFTEERFLLADEMGMFKTAQSIFANSKFRERKPSLRTLIVSPGSVREHWGRELEKWSYPKGDANIVYTKDLDGAIARAKRSTWTVIPYHIMANLDETALARLQKLGFHHVILDEAHNAKNPDALRTRAIKKLADQADYVSLLSGTPIPNTMSDLYVMMSLLNPIEYPFDPEKAVSDTENFRVARQSFIQLYVEHPQAVKELLHRKMLRRKAEDYVGEHIPELKMHRVPIPLKDFHLDTYVKLLERDMHVGKKIMELEKACLDPSLVAEVPNQDFGRDVSQKYAFLDEVIERETHKRGGKVLVFSNLKKGVIDFLTQCYEHQGAISITGDTESDNGYREKLRVQFQRDPKTRVMFATTTMNEGVDLSAATAVVNLTIPWTSSEFHQRYKRSHSPGEIRKPRVDVYTPFVTIPGSQASLDEATLKMLDSKELAVSYLLRGIQVSMEELNSLDRPENIPRIVRAIQSPNKAILNYYIKWRGIGADLALQRLRSIPEVAQYIAELYPSFSMAKNAADIYLPIIERIEKQRGKLENKIDIASGPGMLAQFLGERVIGLDISLDQLKAGKKLDAKRPLIQARMDQLPLADKLSDLVVCSLAYQMSEPKKERSKALNEMSRVLRKGGYAILTVPYNYMTTMDQKRFAETARMYGFEVKEHELAVGPSKMDYYVLQKRHQSSTDQTFSLRWKGDPGGKKK